MSSMGLYAQSCLVGQALPCKLAVLHGKNIKYKFFEQKSFIAAMVVVTIGLGTILYHFKGP